MPGQPVKLKTWVWKPWPRTERTRPMDNTWVILIAQALFIALVVWG
jgi:hypothetical protein